MRPSIGCTTQIPTSSSILFVYLPILSISSLSLFRSVCFSLPLFIFWSERRAITCDRMFHGVLSVLYLKFTTISIIILSNYVIKIVSEKKNCRLESDSRETCNQIGLSQHETKHSNCNTELITTDGMILDTIFMDEPIFLRLSIRKLCFILQRQRNRIK